MIKWKKIKHEKGVNLLVDYLSVSLCSSSKKIPLITFRYSDDHFTPEWHERIGWIHLMRTSRWAPIDRQHIEANRECIQLQIRISINEQINIQWSQLRPYVNIVVIIPLWMNYSYLNVITMNKTFSPSSERILAETENNRFNMLTLDTNHKQHLEQVNAFDAEVAAQLCKVALQTLLVHGDLSRNEKLYAKAASRLNVQFCYSFVMASVIIQSDSTYWCVQRKRHQIHS